MSLEETNSYNNLCHNNHLYIHIKKKEISYDNPELLAFPRDRQIFFFNPHGALDLPIFPRGRKKGSFC